MRRSTFLPAVLLTLLTLLWSVTPAEAQYFGRNKVQYDDFDFKTIQTDNFEIYFYPEERVAVEDAARMAERWYRRHSRTFLREFNERKPLIFYANDADFQQTNVIQGQLGQGTGGVTESLKERVVMPFTGSYKETDHVLGHELVHSFQYDIALRGDTPGFSLRRLPLWLVEGMAEYLSVGRNDPHTAMWLRDAALRDDLPTVEQMTRDMASYFPYRYGQAYSAYIGGKYGDAAVTNLFKLSGRVGVDSAFVYALNISADSLSQEWKQSVRDTYLPGTEGRTPVDSIGRAVIGTPGDKRELNISPAVSPDGRYVAFISRRDIFNTNLYVADSETGQIISELESTKSNPHFDALRFINSAGAWSPDGRRFAFVTFVEGDNEINTFDVESGEVTERIAVKGVGAIQNLAWSPDGRYVAFTGIDGGISDLYILDLNTRTVRQITNDRYADLQPAWSPDGTTLAFTTDRGPEGTNFQTLEFGKYRIGTVNVETREIETIRPFPSSMHHNPQYSPDGRSLYFIADRDGFKDIYRYSLADERSYRVTALQTGVSGITALSPAMSVASQSGRMMFSVYSNSGYTIVALEQDETEGIPITDADTSFAVAGANAGLLPPIQSADEGLVGNYLSDPNTGLPPPQNFEAAEASNRLRLDRIAPPTVGGGYSQGFGTQIYGGVGLFFSDMLGNQSLDVFLQANGTLKDIGGGAFYTNRENRLNWGMGAAHVPILYGGFGIVDVNDNGFRDVGEPFAQILQRIFQTQGGVSLSYPLSQTRRFEISATGVRYGFDIETFALTAGGREEIDPDLVLGAGEAPEQVYLGRVGLAYVGDFSNFGFTSPTQGGRYRVQVTPNFGSRQFVNVLVDYRRYFFFNPVTVAVRGLQSGNYGATSENLGSNDYDNLFVRETLGSPYQLGFVRGYSFSSFFDEESCRSGRVCRVERLYGTRLGLASAEVRLPLLGNDIFGLVNFPFVPTEFVVFTDAGVAWTNESLSFDNVRFSTSTVTEQGTVPARPVVSTGVAARMNLLGAAIFEVFYARTFQRDQDWNFGLVLRPGW
ncbi:peptidase S9 [Longibacter salinarum]|uniref:Peptidase S9 n=1 Tax=Longibacter salinarum TaxID=1850348 RepID=A0A2A8D0N8_9BACT|nr:PD40 domain-containing protein [Longibacter salinarum]PEN14454.1 peptidase S9 [Longibacter salinarum]